MHIHITDIQYYGQALQCASGPPTVFVALVDNGSSIRIGSTITATSTILIHR